MIIGEILSTGDEVLTGTIVDSNATHIAEQLILSGVRVTRHTCVGDDLPRLVQVLEEIGARADVAVVTGGLGPTADDLTAEVAAKAAGVELAFNAAADASIERFFQERDRSRNPSDKKQAYLPDGATVIKNPVGTAPGFRLTIGRCTCYFLPGVPWEMTRMLGDAVLPDVVARAGDRREVNLTRTLCLFGLAEATVGERLEGVTDRFPEVRLGLRAHFPEIHVKLYAGGQDEAHLQACLDRAQAWVMEQVGAHVFSEIGESMEATVGRLLRDKGATVAVAESCTGGLIADWLTNVPGSSDYFLLSAVTYANSAKTNVLGVREETLAAFGAVSPETAREMAGGARRAVRADYGLATSGIAGPDGGSDEKPVGTVCIGIATPDRMYSRRLKLSYGSRHKNKRIFAMAALAMLRKELLGERDG